MKSCISPLHHCPWFGCKSVQILQFCTLARWTQRFTLFMKSINIRIVESGLVKFHARFQTIGNSASMVIFLHFDSKTSSNGSQKKDPRGKKKHVK